jgi:hypothetical protein
MAGAAAHTDPKLINPWGISFFPGQPFWIADNNSGYSTVYDATGATQLAPVLIPAPPGHAGSATPTTTVINTTNGFKVGGAPSQFCLWARTARSPAGTETVTRSWPLIIRPQAPLTKEWRF